MSVKRCLRQEIYGNGVKRKVAEGVKENLKKQIYFAEFYIPIVQREIERLKGLLQGKEKYYSEEIYVDFALNLARQLESMCLRTLIVKMHELKREEILNGSDETEEYNYFCTTIIGTEEFRNSVLNQYSVLYNCIREKVECMVVFYSEVINFFQIDREEIQEKLCSNRKIDKISKISGGAGDVHNGGKQVLKVCLDDKLEILFKPRSMENENNHMKLLQWLAERTELDQYSYDFLSYTDHSWSTIVEYKSCISQIELKNYYKRLGVQLFLAYFLGTKDLHCENIIAYGEYPVIIDLENLVNVQSENIRTSVNEEIYYQLLNSVLYTGLLPFYYWDQKGRGINSSGVSGRGGQQYPFKIPTVVDAGTSNMHIEYRYPYSESTQNLATVNGKFYDPSAYEGYMLYGFKAAYRQVMQNRDKFLVLVKDLEKTKSRFLTADTQRYAMTLSSSYFPSLLAEGSERENYLYSIGKGRENQKREVVESEVKSLLRGDIPYFYFCLNDKALVISQKIRLENYFQHTAMEILYKKMALLSESDLDRQCEFIRVSLELMSDQGRGYLNRIYSAKECKITTKNEKNIEGKISKLTKRLLSQAIWNQDRTEVSWCNVQFGAGMGRQYSIRPMGVYLYDGLAGMLLLMYILKATYKNDEISEVYKSLKHTLFKYTDQVTEDLGRLRSNRTGVFDGEGSIVYTYLILFSMGNENKYLKYAKKHARILERIIDQDDKYDLLSGNAGAAQAFLLLYDITLEKEYLDKAERAVCLVEKDREEQTDGIGWRVETDIAPMAGMAHGNSGILMPVIRLWSLTKNEKYERLADQIWRYEETLYDSGINNWTDVRLGNVGSDKTGAVAWCHGVGGILLSRLECCRYVEENKWKERFQKDMMRAYSKLKDYWKRDSWSLCHGISGNLWILWEAERILEPNAKRYEGIWPDEEIKFLPQERMNPGLFNGYGGVLYYLLKVKGEKIPNILGIECKWVG